MRYAVTIDGEELLVDVAQTSDGRYQTSIVAAHGHESPRIWELVRSSDTGSLTLLDQDCALDLVLGAIDDELDVYASSERLTARVEAARATSGRARPRHSAEVGAVIAPMPGKVVKVLVRAGDNVEVGQALIVVEAMKMENELLAKAKGRIRNVLVEPGDAVDRGQLLMSIEPW
jgi:biotin carboxyl carrier protein